MIPSSLSIGPIYAILIEILTTHPPSHDITLGFEGVEWSWPSREQLARRAARPDRAGEACGATATTSGAAGRATDSLDRRQECGCDLRYLIVNKVFWYELSRTLRVLTVGVRRLYLPSGVMNQVSATKYRTVNA